MSNELQRYSNDMITQISGPVSTTNNHSTAGTRKDFSKTQSVSGVNKSIQGRLSTNANEKSSKNVT